MINMVFFGTSSFAVPGLTSLHQSGKYKITVITSPDKPAGRKNILTPPPVKTVAQALDLDVLQPETLKSPESFQTFKNLQPSFAVVAAYGKIIPKDWISLPKYGFVNIHPSLLPKYRGPSPIQSAIINGEKETGVTIMLIDEEVDHGPVLAAKKYLIQDDRYYPDIAPELATLGADLLAETLPHYLHGELKPIPQDHSAATYTARLSWQNGRIDWSKTAEEIYNRVRGLGSEPGAWTRWKGKILRIHRTRPLTFCVISTTSFGHIAKIENQIAVQTASCPLELLEVQPEGSRPMSVKDFLNGHPDFPGSRFDSDL